MALLHRVGRLERHTPVHGGYRRCAACGNGTKPTGLLVRILGVDQGPRPGPCPGCGRDEPTVIDIERAEPPPIPANAPP
ncbi:MAG TPA: hypothetical protein PKE29_01520 [Phycisphaerales bacterium]|nr:hypothetical protein [Phycisphaerales bacterium]